MGLTRLKCFPKENNQAQFFLKTETTGPKWFLVVFFYKGVKVFLQRGSTAMGPMFDNGDNWVQLDLQRRTQLGEYDIDESSPLFVTSVFFILAPKHAY